MGLGSSREHGFCEETGPPGATEVLLSQAEVLSLNWRGTGEPLMVLEQK